MTGFEEYMAHGLIGRRSRWSLACKGLDLRLSRVTVDDMFVSVVDEAKKLTVAIVRARCLLQTLWPCCSERGRGEQM